MNEVMNYNHIELVFFLEEKSAKTMLEIIVPKIFTNNQNIAAQYIYFDGKQDLKKRITKKIQYYLNPHAKFIILIDQDSNDCRQLKQEIEELCPIKDKDRLLIRIACHELESFYLADLNAVELAYDINNLKNIQNNKLFRNPDKLNNAKQKIKELTKNKYEENLGAQKIAPYLDINNTRSPSFKHLVLGIKKCLIP